MVDTSPPLGTIGADLADRYPERYGFDRHHSFEACTFCGNPTGTCTMEDHLMATKKAAPKATAPRKAAKDKTVAGPVARPDNQGEERTAALADQNAHAAALAAADKAGLRVVVGDVWEDKPSPGAPNEPLHVLVFHGGQVVNQAQLEAAGGHIKTRAVKEGDLPSVV